MRSTQNRSRPALVLRSRICGCGLSQMCWCHRTELVRTEISLSLRMCTHRLMLIEFHLQEEGCYLKSIYINMFNNILLSVCILGKLMPVFKVTTVDIDRLFFYIYSRSRTHNFLNRKQFNSN